MYLGRETTIFHFIILCCKMAQLIWKGHKEREREGKKNVVSLSMESQRRLMLSIPNSNSTTKPKARISFLCLSPLPIST